MTLQALLESKLVWALGGGLVSLTMAYFAFSRDITRDLSYIKGQLSMLLERFKAQDKIQEKVITLDNEQIKVKHDLQNAWNAIRKIQGGANGSAAETSGHG